MALAICSRVFRVEVPGFKTRHIRSSLNTECFTRFASTRSAKPGEMRRQWPYAADNRAMLHFNLKSW
jgi:hypothetical protein